MEAVNCPRCGKVFQKIMSPLCPSCEKAEEVIFQSVKEFIRDHPECTLNELSEGAGVSPKKILRYIREGRLEISKGMHGDVRCEICNRPITKGRYCDTCKIKINQNITDLFSGVKKEHRQGTKMHISEDSKR